MSLLRSSLFVGAAGLISRPLGFLRDVLIATALGAGTAADAFLVASRLPDLARKVLNEGALNAGFVPLYARIRHDGVGTQARFAGEALSGMAVLLLALVAVAEIFAGAFILLVAAGYAGDPETLGLSVACFRLIVPFVFAAGLAALLSALLNAERRYAMAALAPLSINLVLLLAMVVLVQRPELSRDRVALWLSAASGASGFIQLGLVAAALRARPAPLALAKPRLSPEIKRLLRLGLPALALSAGTPLIVLAGVQVASFTPSAVSWLYYAERVTSMPIAFVGAAVSAVLLPAMATQIVSGDQAAFVAAQNRALEAACLLAFPAAAGLWLLAEPIASVLFERGAFGRADTIGTAAAMAGLAAGMPFGMAGKIFSQAFFVRGNLRAALLAGALAVGVTVVASVALSRPLGALGLGLGISVGLAAQALMLGFILHRIGEWRPDARLGRRLAAIAGATGVMALGLSGLTTLAAGAAPSSAREALVLAALCASGLILYALAAWLLNAVTRADLAALKARP